MIEDHQIIAPIVALVAWSMVMWVWMYATRLPAIIKAKMKMDPNAPRGEQMSKLPADVRWKADNYTHLMEQPTVFYALAISIEILGVGQGFNAYIAWTYVALRIVHSIVQATTNKIEVRFLVFTLSNIPLVILTITATRAFLT